MSWAALAGIGYAFPAALGEAGHLSPTRQRKEPPAKRLTGGLVRSLAKEGAISGGGQLAPEKSSGVQGQDVQAGAN